MHIQPMDNCAASDLKHTHAQGIALAFVLTEIKSCVYLENKGEMCHTETKCVYLVLNSSHPVRRVTEMKNDEVHQPK